MKKIMSKCGLLMTLALLISGVVAAQSVTGKVIDSSGAGVAGVSVAVKNGRAVTQTNANGVYTITASSGSTLVFTSIGFANLEEPVSGRSTVDISLTSASSSAGLNEVVVVGYATTRRKDLTGSVSTLTARNFNKGIINAPDQLLQSKIPGLEITVNSGQPGAASTIKIRGNNSIRGGQSPLYVIDGVQLDGRNARPSINLGANGQGFGTTPDANPLLYINPYDVAQIDILKDASASAIYGSRAANGVIVITTKKGTAGASRIEVGMNFGIAGYMKKFKVLKTDEFRDALKTYSITGQDSGSSINPLKEIAQHKLTQNYSLALSGGNENGKYRASFLGSRTFGLLKKSSLDKYIATFNGQYRFLDNRLSIDFNLISGHVTEHLTGVSNTAGSEGNLVSSALIWNPTVPFVNPRTGYYNLNSNGVVNPLAFSDAFSDISNQDNFLGNISASYAIADNFSYKFLYGVNHGRGHRDVNIEGFLQGFAGLSGAGYAAMGDADLTSQIFTHTLNYNTTLSRNLRFDALLGYEYFKTKYRTAQLAAKGFNTNLDQTKRVGIKYTDIFQDAQTQFPTATFVDPLTELQSVFARVNFNLSEKYILTATMRADGSSKFGKNNRYGYFPSVGAKWDILRESFMKGSNLFNTLALRASYGVTGNQEFPPGASQEQFGFSSYNNAGQSIVANPDLKWERTNSFNIGTDFSFKKGKASFSIDYYHKNTTDLLYQASAIQPAPSSTYFINLPARLINAGVELGFNATLTERKNFSWDVNFNVAYNKNELQDFTDINTGLPLRILTGSISGQGVSGTLAQLFTNNEPLNVFFLKPFNGFDANKSQQLGALGTEVVGGDPNPHVIGGFGTVLRYKKTVLSINTGGAFGYMIYNNTATSVTNIGQITSGRNIDEDTYASREAKSDAAAASTRYLEKGDYLKLRNATLSYNVGNLGKYVKNMNVSLTGNNLFVITGFSGFDPEVNIDKSVGSYPSRSIEYVPYPTPRTITLGVNFSL